MEGVVPVAINELLSRLTDEEVYDEIYRRALVSPTFVERAHMVLVAGSASFGRPRFSGSTVSLQGSDGAVLTGVCGTNTGGMRSAVAGSEPTDIEDDFGDIELGVGCCLTDDGECESCQ